MRPRSKVVQGSRTIHYSRRSQASIAFRRQCQHFQRCQRLNILITWWHSHLLRSKWAKQPFQRGHWHLLQWLLMTIFRHIFRRKYQCLTMQLVILSTHYHFQWITCGWLHQSLFIRSHLTRQVLNHGEMQFPKIKKWPIHYRAKLICQPGNEIVFHSTQPTLRSIISPLPLLQDQQWTRHQATCQTFAR